MKWAIELGQSVKNSAAAFDRPRTHFVDGLAIGILDGGRNYFVERLCAVVRNATSAASGMPGTSAHIRPATGTIPFNPPFSGGSRTSPICSGRLRKKSALASSRHGADAGDRMDLAILRADQYGSLPPHPTCEYSVVAAEKIVATPASTALPPV